MQNPEHNDGTKQEAMLASELLDEHKKVKKFWRGPDQNCTRSSECFWRGPSRYNSLNLLKFYQRTAVRTQRAAAPKSTDYVSRTTQRSQSTDLNIQ